MLPGPLAIIIKNSGRSKQKPPSRSLEHIMSNDAAIVSSIADISNSFVPAFAEASFIASFIAIITIAIIRNCVCVCACVYLAIIFTHSLNRWSRGAHSSFALSLLASRRLQLGHICTLSFDTKNPHLFRLSLEKQLRIKSHISIRLLRGGHNL